MFGDAALPKTAKILLSSCMNMFTLMMFVVILNLEFKKTVKQITVSVPSALLHKYTSILCLCYTASYAPRVPVSSAFQRTMKAVSDPHCIEGVWLKWLQSGW